MFSSRVPSNLTPNRLAGAMGRARTSGQTTIDLTLSNPTRAGFDYPPDLLRGLGDDRSLVYWPSPLGLLEAREAVSRDYARRGSMLAPDRIVLTASTSEAYSLVFKVLCDAGDEVLVPRPSYPLFEHLTRLDALASVPYDLEYHGAWSIDIDSMERALSPRTKVILVVSPNNPTGSFITPDELERVAGLCRSRDIAIVADEVFADYELVPGAERAAGHVLDVPDVLTFSLGGASKSIGLPQIKLAWIGVGGPSRIVSDALARLELACDTYLSVSTPVQVAAAELLERGSPVRRQIQTRIAANYRELGRFVETSPACALLPADGGWYGVVRVPTMGSEEDLAVDLLEGEGVLIHPGYFYDFQQASFLIVSLLVPEPEFAAAVSRVLRFVESRAGHQ